MLQHCVAVKSSLRIVPCNITFKTSRSTKGNPVSGNGETFASGIWNLGNLTLCNPKSKSRIRNPTNDRIRTDPSFTEKESGIQSLESGIESVESKIQFPYMGARLHASDSTDFPVAALFLMVTTLFQQCYAVLRSKSSLRIVT